MGNALRLDEYSSSLVQLESWLSGKSEIEINVESQEGLFESFLKANYFREGETIKLKNAALQISEDPDRILVTGTSDYLNVPDLPVTAEFVVQKDGRISPRIHYTLLSRGDSSDKWKFINSFPGLPHVDDSDSIFHGDEFKSFPDQFLLKEARLIVSDADFVDLESGKQLTSGVNFLARAQLYGPLQLLQHLVSEKSENWLYGRVNLPQFNTNFSEEALAASLKRQQSEVVFPWDYAESLPGIHLVADLGEDFQLGSLQFSDTRLQIYCPLDDWDFYDEIYEPRKALTGKLEIEKAEISLDAHAVYSEDSGVFVYTRFEGLSIGNLARLTGAMGGVSLHDHLPKPIQTTVSKLEALEIIDLGFRIKSIPTSVSGVNKLALTYATVQLGVRDLNWEIWKDHLSIDELSVRLEVFNKPKPILKATLLTETEIAGTPFVVTGSRFGSEYLLTATLAESQSIDFKSFMKKCFSDVPLPAELDVEAFGIELCVGDHVTVSGSFSTGDKGWKIDLGKKAVSVEDISFSVTKTLSSAKSSQQSKNSSKVSGYFTGRATLDTLNFQVNYSTPKHFDLKAEIPEVNLSELCRKITGKGHGGPGSFDLKMVNTQVVAEKQNSGFRFRALSTIPKVGMLALQAGKTGGSWGVATGIYLGKKKLSKIEGLEFLEPIEKIANLQDLTLIASTVENAQFQFPTSAAFSGNQTLNSSGVQLPTSPSGVVRGLNVHGTWILKKSDRAQKLIGQIFQLDDRLPVTLQVESKAGQQPVVNLHSSVNATFEGNPLKASFGIRMQAGKSPEYYLLGSGQMNINHHKMLLDIGVSVTLVGIGFTGSLKGTLKLQGLKLSNLGLMGSVNWAGVPGFGFAGRINTRSFQSSIVLLLDTANSSFVLAGSVSELNAYKVVTGLAGCKKLPKGLANPLKKVEILETQEFFLPKTTVKALDSRNLESVASAFSSAASISLPATEPDTLLITNRRGKSWTLVNRRDSLKSYQIEQVKNKVRAVLAPQVYVCTSYARVGALEYQPGFLLSARIRVIEFEAYASIDISPAKGIAIDAYVNKAITIGNKSFFCFSDQSGKKGPQLSVSTYQRSSHPVKEFRSPHLYANGRLRVIGLRMDCLARVSTNALELDIRVQNKNSIRSPVIKGHVDFIIAFQAQVGDIKNFYAKMGVHFDADLRLYLGDVQTLRFKEKVTGYLEMGLKKSKPYAILGASIKLAGESCKVEIELNPTKDNLNHAGQYLAREVSDFFEEIYEDVDRFLDDVGKGVLKGFEDTAKLGNTLAKNFSQSTQGVANAFHSLGKAPEDIASALLKTKVSSKDVAKALKGLKVKPLDLSHALSGAGVKSKDLENALKSVKIDKKSLEKTVSGATKDVTEFVEDVGKSISKLFDSKKKKKKKKKKKSRKATAEEIAKKLSPLTDNRDYICKRIMEAGHSKQSALRAVKKFV